MSSMRDIIEKLSAISEERPAKGDGIFLEFSDTLEVETEIVEITESGDIVVLGDARFISVIESLELSLDSLRILQDSLGFVRILLDYGFFITL